MCCNSVTAWRDLIYKRVNNLGFEHTLLAIFRNRNSLLESKLAFLHSNCPAEWRKGYDVQKRWYVDPSVSHCTKKSIPVIWSPDLFATRMQKDLYEEACRYGLRSGVALPIHGAQGEMGILCLLSNREPGKRFQCEAQALFPELSYFRDCVLETSLRFMKPSTAPEIIPPLTRCELECLKWCAAGKSSGDIAQILNCSAAAVNFHFTSLRNKFNVSSRHQVVIKALQLGLL
jgi:LuxR family quorum-sensing transcriptional regulator LasR